MNYKYWIKYILAISIGIVSLVFIGTLILPERVVYSQKATFSSSAENLSVYFNDIQQWASIIPWLAVDTVKNKEYTLSQGNCINWRYLNSQSNQGNFCIQESNSNNQIAIEISFKEKSSLFHHLIITKVDEGHTELHWKGYSEMLKGLNKWEYFFIHQWLKHDIGIAFEKLPQLLADQGMLDPWLSDLNEFFVPKSYLIFQTDTMAEADIYGHLPKIWTKINEEIYSTNLETWEYPYFILKDTLADHRIIIEVGLSVKKLDTLYQGKYFLRHLEGDTLTNILFKGSLKNYKIAVDSLISYQKLKGYQTNPEVIIAYKDSSKFMDKILPKIPFIVSVSRKRG